ncbi:MAG TPA: hypothetical protein VNB49_06760 [Candidatus Dormibacteraeota bacterium]|nr:hypothetical protein [Candidatus Dormibacteraeota bacterium]
MPMRVIPDENQPSAAIEIPLEKPLLDYDLEELEQPTPRDVDGILVTQGFRDLVDDARGILTELIANPPAEHHSNGEMLAIDLTKPKPHPLEITQLTGAICPTEDEVYRPGLWVVLRDPAAPTKSPLPESTLRRVSAIAAELVKRLQLA